MAKVEEKNGMYQFSDTEGLDPSLTNEDILPTTVAQRTWSFWHLASLWVGMAVCIPTYMLASSMLIGGLSWKEAMAMIILGNIIVAIPMIFNGHAGTKYGIPFPVLGRASFGHLGIHIPSILRAIVACGWFGIQTWLGGLAIVAIVAALLGNPEMNSNWNYQFAGFMFFWFINMFFVWKGTESIKLLETLAAPLLILVGIGMLYWGVSNAGGLSKVLESSDAFSKPAIQIQQYNPKQKPKAKQAAAQPSSQPGSKPSQAKSSKALVIQLNLLKNSKGKVRANKYRYTFGAQASLEGQPLKAFEKSAWKPLNTPQLEFSSLELKGQKTIFLQFANAKKKLSSIVATKLQKPNPSKSGTSLMTYLFWLTAMVAFWATLALNIPDFTRFSKSQKDQALGQLLGLPTTMTLYSFIGVAVTCAAIVIFDDILIATDAPWDPVRLLARFQDSPVILIIAQLSILLATLSTNIAANVISPANSFSNVMPQHISFRMGGLIAGVLGIVIMPWKLLGLIIGYLLTYGAILGPVVGILIVDYFIVQKKQLVLEDLYKTDGKYSYTNGFNIKALLALFLGVTFVLLGLKYPAMKPFYDTGWFSGFFLSSVLYVIFVKVFTPSSKDAT